MANNSFRSLVRSRILRRILGGFGLVAAILSIGLVITNNQFEQLNEQFRGLLEHDIALVDETKTLTRLVSVLQSNKRGFIITGDDEFLARYDGARQAIVAPLARLRRATAGHPLERELIDRVSDAVDRYEELSARDIALRQRAARGEIELTEVLRRMATSAAPPVLGDAERALQELHDAQLQSVEAQRSRVEIASVRSKRLPLATMVLALFVAVIYGTTVARGIGESLGRLQDSIEAMGQGQLSDPPAVRDDEIADVAWTFHDMATRLARYQREIRHKVSEQESTLEELRKANDALGKAMRVKSDFLAIMSHELRTPLNAVIGLSGMLLDSRAEQLSPRARQALETMRGSGNHLLALLNDILDMAKLEAGRMTFMNYAFDPTPLARSCVATVIPLLGDKPVEVSCHVSEAVSSLRSDPQRVSQILLNLLSNAVKFTHKGTVALRVERDGDRVNFRIRDTGIGIAREAQPRLFEEFHQVVTGDARPYGGTGLGLALSRRMARALGGDVSCDSEAGRGSTFTLTLPIERPDDARNALPAPLGAANAA